MTHNLTTLAQIALLSEDEFERMLPDFFAWFAFAKSAQKLDGVEVKGFEWCDDGNPGTISSVKATDMSTGEVHEIRGSA